MNEPLQAWYCRWLRDNRGTDLTYANPNLVAAHGDNPWMRDAITRVQEQLHAARMHKLSLIRELHR